MKVLDSFADKALVEKLTRRIAAEAAEREGYTFMEVCGTHTQAIGRWGLRNLLPENVRLVSGPGCPVCVTPGEYIDNACCLALKEEAIIATFGDLVRVPGLTTSLEEAQGQGADIRTLYSPFDAIQLAANTDREVVFLAIGFETTIAGIAATIHATRQRKLKNLSFYLSFRLVPPALTALLSDPELQLDGFLLPGHVSIIIGLEPYQLLKQHHSSGVVIGFEPVDILQGVEVLIAAVNAQESRVENLYPRAVKPEGNPAALSLFEQLFDIVDTPWRGIGVIPSSGYALKDSWHDLDAEKRFHLPPLTASMPPGCCCGEVLKGIIQPDECPLFAEKCLPTHPIGPCMVSGEGSCAAYYKYRA
ncbi:MAG: hydrogenase formation protein HypD [Planctomycetes bacterium]|nr:hydrogenase formation protein HypD [Planctomycetota bacterium]